MTNEWLMHDIEEYIKKTRELLKDKKDADELLAMIEEIETKSESGEPIEGKIRNIEDQSKSHFFIEIIGDSKLVGKKYSVVISI